MGDVELSEIVAWGVILGLAVMVGLQARGVAARAAAALGVGVAVLTKVALFQVT
ncbi:MAG TPA: hypothetical protein VE033_06680 [Acetobacteraceae bacterium]|jgi:hypothetical protein|nr:hypothetical protein [Acetobacteraceae bacterium]